MMNLEQSELEIEVQYFLKNNSDLDDCSIHISIHERRYVNADASDPYRFRKEPRAAHAVLT